MLIESNWVFKVQNEKTAAGPPAPKAAGEALTPLDWEKYQMG